MNTLRWVLAIALAPVGYVIAVVTAILLSQLLTRFCPVDLLVSGTCMASWYLLAEMIGFAVAAAIGAAVWVALPVLLAPAHRNKVAWIAFASGTALAVWFVLKLGSDFIGPFASALVAGISVALTTGWRRRYAT